MLILGDAGFNYFYHPTYHSRTRKDRRLKREAQDLPITLLMVYGNHEIRPENLPSYKPSNWHEGTVLVEDDYPSLLFLQDGEIYDIEGKSVLVIGGAFSIDKGDRIYSTNWKYRWFHDEQPSDTIKRKVEAKLEEKDWQVDVVLSHTIPEKYVPTEAFLPGIDQSSVDRTTEIWLGEIEQKLTYSQWWAGHWHLTKRIDKLQIVYEEVMRFE